MTVGPAWSKAGQRFTSQETVEPAFRRNFSRPTASFFILTTMKGTRAPSWMSVTPTTSQGESRDILSSGGNINGRGLVNF